MAEIEMGAASGEELTDETERKLTEDLKPEADAGNEEEPAQPPDSEDLPEGLAESDADKDIPPAEPSGESEVERLTRLGVLREGYIEDFDQLAKSYKSLERKFSETKRVPRDQPPSEQPTSQAEIKQLTQGLMSEDPDTRIAAVVQIANAVNFGDREKLKGIDRRLFADSHADYAEYREDIANIEAKYPGMDIDDVYNMAVGKNKERLISSTKKTEQRRETDKQLATRERPGAGVRTGPADLNAVLAELANKYQNDPERLRSEMNSVLARHGK